MTLCIQTGHVLSTTLQGGPAECNGLFIYARLSHKNRFCQARRDRVKYMEKQVSAPGYESNLKRGRVIRAEGVTIPVFDLRFLRVTQPRTMRVASSTMP